MPDDFVAVVRQYGAWLETLQSKPREQFALEASTLLAKLIALGLELPDAEPDTAAATETASERDIQASCAALLGEWDSYASELDPDRRSPAMGLISVDLAEIYAELTGSLSVFDGGRRDDAVWDWRFGLRYHWGQHATSALRALLWRLAVS